ncbi:GntR family transcriptional regulator [Streptomyces sp. NPDC047706]|uniref:GntR family transcriptional regulator n=1 Tax=Streptomyces sp. NPDC047706 TaxID=3365486 RepID=UPI0037112218
MIDRTQPVYPQLVSILRTRITDGTYTSGSRMPAVLTVASEFDVAASTVQRAFAALRAEGLIITWSDRGSFVAEQS